MQKEGELLERCLNGETSAWNELFDAHYAPTGRFIYQLSADFTVENAEEICQEVFLAVIKNLDSFAGDCQLQTWIFRIATNKARDFLAKRQANKRGGGQTPVSLQAENPETGQSLDPPTDRPGPDESLMSEETAALVQASLHQLEAPCREIVELRYFGDLSYEELGKTLQLNTKTVSSRLSKCLDRLEKIARSLFSRENPGISRPTT